MELSDTEKKIHIVIAREGISTAESISEKTGISFDRVKESIENLSSKGFASVISSKPMKQWKIL